MELLQQVSSCQEWAERLAEAPIPVLRVTRDALDAWRERSDMVDAHLLADIALRDPLLCLRLLVHTARRFGHRLATPAQTVTAALVLTGVDPFFRDFQNLPVLEERLADHYEALHGVLRSIERAHRAARLAAAFAIHRQDEHAEMLHQAALLQDFVRLLLWCDAPALVAEMDRRQRADSTLRSVEVQREVLGFDLPQLSRALIARWGLPDALGDLVHPFDPDRAGPTMVRLAVRIARHVETGWDNAALPDDFADLGFVLNLTPHAAAMLVRRAVD